MHVSFKTSGVCSQNISFDLDNNIVTNINFIGGCPGNLKLIAKILNGKSADEVIKYCKGNTCGYKSTSCGDQLAKAVEEARSKIANN